LVYWANYYTGTIYSMPVDGGTVSTVAVGPTSVAAIELDDINMYWSTMDYPGSVYTQPKSGGSRTTLAAYMSPTLGLLIRGNWLYWSSSSYIYRIPKSGGVRETLASGLNSAWDLASDGTNLFWVEFASPGGCVKQMPLDGGPIITLATNLTSPTALVVDDKNVYWAEGDNRVPGSIKWVAKAEIQPDTIAPQLFVNSPLTGTRVSDPTQPIAGTAVDDVAVALVEFQVNGGPWDTATGTTNWNAATNLQRGTNTIVVRARDTSGNTSAVVYLTVVYLPPDVTAPTFTIAIPTTNAVYVTSNSTVSLGGQQSDDVAVISMLYEDERGGNGAATLSGSAWASGPIALHIGQNNLTITASDAAGNSLQKQIIVDRLSPAHNTLGFMGNPLPGQIQFRFYGQPRATYEIQASTTMVYWLPVGTNTVPVIGYFDFTRVVLGDEPNEFFRVKAILP
jgi:hypothetical protein